ncbi:MAG: DNA adenine methylase [Acidobacteriaceae bacterium]
MSIPSHSCAQKSRLTRPALRYHGGKWKLAPWIIAHMPPHRIYVELFGGGGSVLLRKPRSYAEIYNDRWETVVNVFRVLRDEGTAERLREQLRLTPFARSEFEDCGEDSVAAVSDPVERARRTILRSFAGFGSAAANAKYATGFRANSHRSGTTAAHDWANFPDHIECFVERLRGVCIESRDALEIIPQQDGADTLFYADPPYVHSTRNMKRGNAAYEFEMLDADHAALSLALHQVRGMVLLSGYACDLYCDLYQDWHSVTMNTFANSAKAAKEILWINPAALERTAGLFREGAGAR